MKLIVKLKFKTIILVIYLLFIISQAGEKMQVTIMHSRQSSTFDEPIMLNNAEPKSRSEAERIRRDSGNHVPYNYK